jgi:FixJ family two-component response regulator
LQKGARHFVQKPVKPDVLYEIIRYVLSDEDAQGHSQAPATVGEARS